MRAIVLAVLATLALAAGTADATIARVSTAGRLARAVLTQDGTGTYAITRSGGVVAMLPGSGTGSNQREVYWPGGQAPAADAEVCATWAGQSGDQVQEGLALRITTGTGGTRAVTITKNVWAGITWVINAHVWDSTAAEPFTAIGQWDMAGVLNTTWGLHPMPWRVCARTVGDRLDMRIWVPSAHAEPGWDDPVHARSATIPAGWLGAGQTGWYVGHLPPAGGWAIYTDLAAR